jgi:ribosomal protein S18 acetylase RimI-like enzyme
MNTDDQAATPVVPRLLDRIRTLATSLRPRRITPAAPPFIITDDDGREVHFRPYRETDFDSLVPMYDDFDPTQRAQGVPPLDTEDIRGWLASVLGGPNVVATVDDKIVGHVGFVPDGTDRHELLIFVHQEYQQAGIGSTLMAAGLGHAKQAGVGYVWLSVEKTKRYQQRFYGRAGFSAVNPTGMTYRMSRSL